MKSILLCLSNSAHQDSSIEAEFVKYPIYEEKLAEKVKGQGTLSHFWIDSPKFENNLLSKHARERAGYKIKCEAA